MNLVLDSSHLDLAEAAAGPLAASEEVPVAVADLGRTPWLPTERYNRFRQASCSPEDGHATERVLELFSPAGPPGPSGAAPTHDGKRS